MGKRSGKRGGSSKHRRGNKKVKQDWAPTVIPEDNELFRRYYQEQLLLNKEDFKAFWAAMKEKLPVVFRVNPNFANHQSFCRKLQDEKFLQSFIETSDVEMKAEGEEAVKAKEELGIQKHSFEPTETPIIELLKWYPGNVVFSMNTNKQELKKSKTLANFHRYLQKAFDSGLICRQELVSMLPPLYLNVKPGDIVLDMCAAPGSKTSQILEMLQGQSKQLDSGCVIANDADYSRAQMLIHQLNRAGTAGMAVTNHAGQFLPELYSEKINSIKNKFQYDKILCDVPCSGDGATRKIPIKWVNWHTSDGISLHPLQFSIVLKSLNLLKKGGYLVYSTCSLNPMEDQAVLYALFQKVSKGLQIVDIHKLYDIKGRRGLLHWKVMGVETKPQKDEEGKHIRALKQYKCYEDGKHDRKIKPTLFPPASEEEAKKVGLQNSMRILPHDQNSGGFFIALLKKNEDFEWKYQVKKQGGHGKEEEIADRQQRFVEENLAETENNVIVTETDQKKEDKPENESEEDQSADEEVEEQKPEHPPKNIQPEAKVQSVNESSKKKKQKGTKYETFAPIEPEELQVIQKFYGISDEIKDQLFVRDNVNSKRRVLLLSKGVKRFIDFDINKKINLVNMGCKVFEKGKQSFAGHECLYRICQEGVHLILPYIEKRKVKVPLSFFKRVLEIHSLTHDQIEDVEVRDKIRIMTQGSFCIYIDEIIEGNHVIDAMVGQNFKNSFHLLVAKDDVASLNIRYM